jgi:hypothetical protein
MTFDLDDESKLPPWSFTFALAGVKHVTRPLTLDDVETIKRIAHGKVDEVKPFLESLVVGEKADFGPVRAEKAVEMFKSVMRYWRQYMTDAQAALDTGAIGNMGGPRIDEPRAAAKVRRADC